MDFAAPAISVIKAVALFVLGFLSSLLLPHVKLQFEEYNATLTDISRSLHNSAALIFTWEFNEKKEEHLQLHERLRGLRARLLASTTTIPAPVLWFLRLLRLVKPQNKIDEAAMMLVGISNFIMATPKKDRPLLTDTVRRLGKALGISVGG